MPKKKQKEDIGYSWLRGNTIRFLENRLELMRLRVENNEPDFLNCLQEIDYLEAVIESLEKESAEESGISYYEYEDRISK